MVLDERKEKRSFRQDVWAFICLYFISIICRDLKTYFLIYIKHVFSITFVFLNVMEEAKPQNTVHLRLRMMEKARLRIYEIASSKIRLKIMKILSHILHFMPLAIVL